jgi:hypothetical protein
MAIRYLFAGFAAALLLCTAAAQTPTATVLGVLPPTVIFGQQVTLTATVTPAPSEGSVTFYDGVVVLGSTRVVGGQATWTTAALEFGPHQLHAVYWDGISFRTSASAPAPILVRALPGDGFAFPIASDITTPAVPIDFNGDEVPDRIRGEPNCYTASDGRVFPGLAVSLGNGDGTFRDMPPFVCAEAFYFTMTSDFNRDGKLDIVIMFKGAPATLITYLATFLGNGDGTFRFAGMNQNGPTGFGWAGDVNNDGNADLYWTGGPAGFGMYLGNGVGGFQFGSPVTEGLSDRRSPLFKDVNHDGKADIVVLGAVKLGNGDGTFQPPLAYSAPGANSFAIGDFNGDGNADIVTDDLNGGIHVLLGNGDGTFQPQRYFPSLSKGPLSVLDANGDGVADVAQPGVVWLGMKAAVPRDTTPPTITPVLSGSLGGGGWYRSPVTVAWNVSDPDSTIASSSGCNPVTLTADTAGTRLTCTAANVAGLSSSVSVLIKIDKTPPQISGMPVSGCALWPPNQKLTQVAVVTASDALSGLVADSFKVSVTSNEPSDPSAPDFVITPNGTGGYVVQLRADRLGNGNDRIYTVTATGSDVAGNTGTATATCAVPHDRGQ